MLSVREIRSLARSMTLEKFRAQLGPFALVRRPPGQEGMQFSVSGLPSNLAATDMSRPENVSQGTLSLLFEFEDLEVAALPPVESDTELVVGRQPDCDLLIDDRSVSKRHAVIRWDAEKACCLLNDLGSTNGTFLNAHVRVSHEVALRDGDILSFGDAPFWYLLSETLYAKLSKSDESTRLGSRSG